MAAQKAEGIILRKYLLRETSYILVVFTKEFGKVRGVLKGARNPYPQFAGNFEIFTRCELLFYRKKKKSMDLVTGCDAIDFFLPVRKDIERTTYANYFVELVDIVTADHDANERLYSVLLDDLSLLAKASSPKRTARIFEIKLLDAVGLGSRLDECSECSSSCEGEFRFSVRSGGILCPDCSKKDSASYRISRGTLNFMRKIQSTPFSRTQHVKVSREVGEEAEKALKRFIQYHIGRQTKSMKFLEDMERRHIIK